MWCTCKAVVLLIKTIVFWRCRFRLRRCLTSLSLRSMAVSVARLSGEAARKISKSLPPQSPCSFSALARLYYLARPTKTAMLRRLKLPNNAQWTERCMLHKALLQVIWLATSSNIHWPLHGPISMHSQWNEPCSFTHFSLAEQLFKLENSHSSTSKQHAKTC